MFTFRKQSILLCLILGIMCFFQSQSQAQVAITAVPFLQINNDARSMGMAGANVAMRGARSGIHLNPAAFGKPGKIEFTSQLNLSGNGDLFGTQWLPKYWSSNLNIYSPQFIVGFNNYSIAYQYTHFDLGKHYNANPTNPEPKDSFQSYENAHTLSAAYHLSPYVSVGMGLNFIRSSLGSGTVVSSYKVKDATRISLDLGVYADYPMQHNFFQLTPSFGWSITDIGRPVKYTANVNGDPMPIIMRGGIGLDIAVMEKKYGLEVLQVSGYLSLDKIMARSEPHITQNGDTTRKAMGPIEALFNSWDSYSLYTGSETVSVPLKDQLRRHSGLEITLLEYVSLRFGRYWEHEHNGNRKYNTYGFGINLKYLSIDYSKINTDVRYHALDQTSFFQFTAKVPFDDIEHWFN
ncbi:hypothetical protein SAMN06265219_107142 [Gracilimonas mengyeensis]|uniref:Long-chain fatty acid transport protein n=2 Tax=Gracilimonas mengyeensis TaxID=1302730 RepID=A0A521D5F6_9BACT|nr:hypothetical protein SAMN06265219_107142 [Gracilimonas mengyeensis]